MKLNQLFVLCLLTMILNPAEAGLLGHLNKQSAEKMIHNEDVNHKVEQWIMQQPHEKRWLYNMLNTQVRDTMHETLINYPHRSQYNEVCKMWKSIPEILPLIRLHTEGSIQRKNAWNNALWTNPECQPFMQ